MDAIGISLIEGGHDCVAIMTCLLETDLELLVRGVFSKPFGEQADPRPRVGEAFGAGLLRADEMAEQFGFSDIDAEEKARRIGGVNGSFHQWFVCPQRALKTSQGGGVAVS